MTAMDEARTARRLIEPVGALMVSLWGHWAILTGGSLQAVLGASAALVAVMLVGRTLVTSGDLTRLETGGMALLGAHALVFPLVFVTLGFTRLPLAEVHVRQALGAHVALISAAWMVLAVVDARGEPPRPAATLARAVSAWAGARPVAGIRVLTVMALLVTAVFLGYAASTGFFFNFSGADRRAVYLATGEERLWFVRYGMQGLLLWTLAAGFGRPGQPWIRRLALAAVGCFVLATLGLGGRRDVVGVLLPLGVLLYVSTPTRWARRGIVAAGVLALLGLFAFAVVRTGSSDRTVADLLTLYDLLGEFLFPWQVTAYLVANPPAPLWGASYLYPLVLWVPRRAWPDKPVILAEQFGQQAGVQDQLGFGFSPVAEAIWNFGASMGPWVGGALVALVLRGGSSLATGHPLLYLGLMGRLLSVPRGELASVLGELLVLWAVFLACDLVAALLDWGCSALGLHSERGGVPAELRGGAAPWVTGESGRA